jgi:hypothetical protein
VLLSFGNLISRFGGHGDAANAAQFMHRAAQSAPTELLSQGLAAMFRSDQTPPFGQMTAQLFSQADPDQRAGMLDELLCGMDPAALQALTGSSAGSSLRGLVSQQPSGMGASVTVTREQASQLTPEQVGRIASHAEQRSPGIIDKMSAFCADQPGLIETLGGAALSIALAKMTEHPSA